MSMYYPEANEHGAVPAIGDRTRRTASLMMMARTEGPRPFDPVAASVYDQGDYDVRFDWGLDGALVVGVDADIVVVVDVLSFTTSVSVAVDRGALVYPYRWRDDSASVFADEHSARLAVGRGEDGISLSPVSLGELELGDRIVLPSPNGATICAELAARGTRVIAGSIRNAAQVAAFVAARESSVAVTAAGEHWPGSSSLRPSLEDVVGAGAILDRLSRRSRSPEALAAVGAFAAVADDLVRALEGCVSGRELIASGYAADVQMAATPDPSAAVPLLSPEGFFGPAAE